MAIDYPTSLDSFSNPSPTNKLNSPSHSAQHSNANDALEALEAKVGVTSSAVTTTHDYKLSGVTGADKASSLAGTETLTNKTIIQKVTSYTPEAAGTAEIDLTDGNIHSITMPAGNITISVSNEAVGQCFIIEITQDAVGSRTVTWFTTIRWPDAIAPTLTTTTSKRDIFGFRVTGTDTYDGVIVGQNL